MLLQKLLWPRVGICTEDRLYYRMKAPSFRDEGDILRIEQGERVCFDTYFNSVSADKWRRYTAAQNFSLRLKLSGKLRVVLCSRHFINSHSVRAVLAEKVVQADSVQEFCFDFPKGADGMLFFELQALSGNAAYCGGAYECDAAEKDVQPVKIGVDICTFRREPFVMGNIARMRSDILENAASPLHNHLEVFVSDNGQTLDYDKLNSDTVHVVPNANVGGAGGFTRGMIEILKANENGAGVTHVLVMDDDIVLDTDVLLRTYTLLSLRKPEYADVFVGGAMLRLDRPNIQVENGAAWNQGQLISHKANFDLTKVDLCVANELEERHEYNAWWYCCIPIAVVRPDNLPMPIFIRGDDIEYGLRNCKRLVTLNGICVWHEPFENKYSSFLEYYIMRNQLIDNSFHCQWYGARQLNRAILGHCFREVTFYRYKNVDLYLQGIKDFLKGPGWLMEQDGEALHKSVMAAGYRGQELNTLDVSFDYPTFEKSYKYVDSKISKIKRLLTLNGLFLRAKGNNVVPMAAARPALFYRKKKVLQYDVTSRKGFVTEKSFKTSMRCLFSALRLTFTVRFKLKKAQNAWRTEGLKLRTLEFWNGFLGLN